MTRVGIVDVGISNLGSLIGALSGLDVEVKKISSPNDFDGFDRIIIPGVGTFHEGMSRLKESGLANPVSLFAKQGKPLLGICLGMQLLAQIGEEGGKSTSGLGLIEGTVTLLDSSLPGIRVPHIGWNSIDELKNHPLLTGIAQGTDFYFVHSFAYSKVPDSSVQGVTHHGKPFPSVVGNGSVVGVQFHPEKSQKNGLRVLENFIEWTP